MWQRRLSAAAYPSGDDSPGRCGARPRRRVQPVPDRTADGLAADRRGDTVEVVGELISGRTSRLRWRMMARFGVQVQREGWQRFIVPAERIPLARVRSTSRAMPRRRRISWRWERSVAVRCASKASAANSVQGDVRFADALRKWARALRWGRTGSRPAPENGGKLRGIELDCNHIPDAAMTLATTALFADGHDDADSEHRQLAGQGNRPHRGDGDRIAQARREVEEGADFIRITPPHRLLRAAQGIDTYDDHRIAMCFSLASWRRPVRINDPAAWPRPFPTISSALPR
jgi:3-phosphoshikimate 1-carboxyvinyltransferase